MTNEEIAEKYRQKFRELITKHNYKPEDYKLTFNFLPDIKPNNLWRFKILLKENKYYASKWELQFEASIHNDEGHPDFWKSVDGELVSKLTKADLKKNAFADIKKEGENEGK